MRRLSCPRCGTNVVVAPGEKPTCANCGYGAPARQAAAPPPRPPRPRRKGGAVLPILLVSAIVVVVGGAGAALWLSGALESTEATAPADASSGDPQSVPGTEIPATVTPAASDPTAAAAVLVPRDQYQPVWHMQPPHTDCAQECTPVGDCTIRYHVEIDHDGLQRRHFTFQYVQDGVVVAEDIWGGAPPAGGRTTVYGGCPALPLTLRAVEDGGAMATFQMTRFACDEQRVMRITVRAGAAVTGEEECTDDVEDYASGALGWVPPECPTAYVNVAHDGRRARTFDITVLVDGVVVGERRVGLDDAWQLQADWDDGACMEGDLLEILIEEAGRPPVVIREDVAACTNASSWLYVEWDGPLVATFGCG